jgi:hypothetical protein
VASFLRRSTIRPAVGDIKKPQVDLKANDNVTHDEPEENRAKQSDGDSAQAPCHDADDGFRVDVGPSDEQQARQPDDDGQTCTVNARSMVSSVSCHLDARKHHLVSSGLVNLRLNEEIDADTFAKKQTELRDRESALKLNMEALDRSHHEIADLAVKAFELSQTLRDQWLTADHATKRRILEIVCLNCKLVDATLVCEMRKPFDVLAEGLLSANSRDDRI